jgi:hypothetical protein
MEGVWGPTSKPESEKADQFELDKIMRGMRDMIEKGDSSDSCVLTNLAAETQRGPAGGLISVRSSVTCAALAVAARIRKLVEVGRALRWATKSAVRITYFPAI